MNETRKLRALSLVLITHVYNQEKQMIKYKRSDPKLVRDGVNDHRVHAVIHIISINCVNIQGNYCQIIGNDDINGMDIDNLGFLFSNMNNNIRRGDLIFNRDIGGSLGQGGHIFDGYQCASLSSIYNDFGHVPKEFCIITEFPPGYWKDVKFTKEHIIDYCDYYSITDATDCDWGLDIEIEFIDIKKLGIDKRYTQVLTYLQNLNQMSAPPTVPTMTFIHQQYPMLDITKQIPYIDFTFNNKRYLLIINNIVIKNDGIIPIFRYESDIYDLELSGINPDNYAYIMLASQQ